MPWWAWALAVPLVLFFFVWMARRAFRRAVRQEFVAFLSETRPEVQVTAETEDALTLTVEGGHGGTLYLHKFYLAIASVPGTAEARREVFVHFADTLLSERAAESTLSLETHGDRVLPRIVSEAMLSGLPSEVPRSPVVGTPLQVVYVLDSEKSVAYLTGAHLADLGLDAAAVHERALHNLRQRFPDGPVRTAVNERSLCVIKSGDSYDAARLLLVPGYLRDGEVLAAGVPDRDTLFLTAPPADGDWSGLQKLARATAGPRLLDRPLRVTRAGFEVV